MLFASLAIFLVGEQYGQLLGLRLLFLLSIVASHSCPSEQSHQTFWPEFGVKFLGNRGMFLVGCHSAHKDGLFSASEFSGSGDGKLSK